jgi:HEPN domain-containing protein
MPPEIRDVGDPHEWLRRARSNLARARLGHGRDDVLLEDLCFDIQQAAEKSLKAVLVFKKVPFPRTHALSSLLSLFEQADMKLPEGLDALAELTVYAVSTRYPGDFEEVSDEEYRRSLTLAEMALEWADKLVNAR